MLFLVVELHGAERATGEATSRGVAAECGITAVGVQVFTQVDQILTATKNTRKKATGAFTRLTLMCAPAGEDHVIPVFTIVAAVGLLVAVAELDVAAQRGR